MKYQFLILTLVFAASSSFACDVGSPACPGLKPAYAKQIPYQETATVIGLDDLAFFDWDDTVMRMPTQIRLFKKGSKDFKDVNSADFVGIRPQLTQAGSPWAAYEFRRPSGSSTDDSFLDFGPGPHLASQLQIVLGEESPSIFMAPEFERFFLTRLASAQSASRTYILTARTHTPAEWQEALEKQLKPYIKAKFGVDIFIPPAGNYIGVGYAADVPAEKAKQMFAKLRDWTDKVARAFFLDDDTHNTDGMIQASKAPENADVTSKVKIDVVPVLAKPSAPAARSPQGALSCTGVYR